MTAKSKNIKSNLKKVDTHSIQSNEYDELPELTDEMFRRAVRKVGGIEKPLPQRRESQKALIKIALRLPSEVVDYFRKEGRDWEIKMSKALKHWIRIHPHR